MRIAPFAAAVAKLDEVPGISLVAAHATLAEIGLDMTRFPTAGHLVSWAKYAPGVSESAGKKKGKVRARVCGDLVAGVAQVVKVSAG